MNEAFAMDRVVQSSFNAQENIEYVTPISENDSGYLRPISFEKFGHVTPTIDTPVVEPLRRDEGRDQEKDLAESFDNEPSQDELQGMGCPRGCDMHGYVSPALKGESLEVQNVHGTDEDSLDHVMPDVEQERGNVSYYEDLKQVKIDVESDKHFYQKLFNPKSG